LPFSNLHFFNFYNSSYKDVFIKFGNQTGENLEKIDNKEEKEKPEK
jgi:hypothetical protein